MKHIIESPDLVVGVSRTGACLTSIVHKASGRELLYQVTPGVWDSQDIIVFPVIDWPRFKIDGRLYRCNEKHGVLRHVDAKLVSRTEDSLKLRFTSDERSLSQFPFRFVFDVSYKVSGLVLSVQYTVTNLEKEPMPFYIGGHPGLYAKGGVAELHFDEPVNPRLWVLEDEHVVESRRFGSFKSLVISKESLKQYRTFIFSEFNHSDFLLRTADVDYRISTKAPVIGLWSKPHAGEYVCFEPWWGMAQENDENREFREKDFVNVVSDSATFGYSILFDVR